MPFPNAIPMQEKSDSHFETKFLALQSDHSHDSDDDGEHAALEDALGVHIELIGAAAARGTAAALREAGGCALGCGACDAGCTGLP